MTRARLAALAALLVLGASAPAAQVSLRLALGADADLLGDVQRQQDLVLQSVRDGIGVPAEATDRFPPFLSVRGDVVVPLEDGFRVGVEGGFSSAGGRVAYSDVTGSYRYDQVVRRVYLGAYSEITLARPRWGEVSGTLRHRYSAGRLDMEEVLVVGGQTLGSGSGSLDQLSFSLQPEVAMEVRVAGPLAVRAHAAWEQTLWGGLTADGAAVSIDGDGADRINWSGPRLGLGAALQLGS